MQTFKTANDDDRAAFYRSAIFQAWDGKVRQLTEGSPHYRQLHGLEAWFRAKSQPPARWKMARLTFVAVYALTLPLTLAVGPLLRGWPLPVANALFNLIVVSLLTWAVMPALTRVARGWLHPAAP